MPRHRLTIAYDGTDFHGWQRQMTQGPDAGGGGGGGEFELRTVQGELRRAVVEVVREPVEVVGASRTDAGVHARAQTAAFTTSPGRRGAPDERLALAINARLPEDALVVAHAIVRDDFDPISDCVAKGYRYSLYNAPTRPLWDRKRVNHVREPLDLEAMRDAAIALVGEHDFAAFAKAGHGRESTVRTVLGCDVRRRDETAIDVDVSGNGFLYNMVRIIAGTLVEAGKGRKTREDIENALASGDRRLAGPTLPPHGLCLMWMRYPDDEGAPLSSPSGG